MGGKSVHMVTFVLAMVGALNWGLVGLFDFNLVTTVLNGYPMLVRVVYILVGLSAVILLLNHKSECKHCMEGGKKK